MKKIVFALLLMPQLLLAQYGYLDSTFGVNGISYPMKDIKNTRPRGEFSLAVQHDDKILVTGQKYGSSKHLSLFRCLPNGELDQTFNERGYIEGDEYSFTTWSGNSLGILSDQSIILGVSMPHGIGIIKYQLNGKIDENFGVNGLVNTDVSGTGIFQEIKGLIISDDDEIILCGNMGSDDGVAWITKYDSNGVLDNSFGVNGVAVFDIPGHREFVSSMRIQDDNKIILAGRFTTNVNGSVSRMMVVRFNENGSLDNSFGEDGYIYFHVPDQIDTYGYSLHVQDNGQILVCGQTFRYWQSLRQSHSLVVRFNADGTNDPLFGNNGILLFRVSMESWAYSVMQKSDGSIIVGTVFRVGFDEDVAIYKFNDNGDVDISFGNAGIFHVDFGTYGDALYSIKSHCDRILVLGSSGAPNTNLMRVITDSNFRECQVVEDEIGDFPKTSVYPNPVASGTQVFVQFNVPKDVRMNASLIDAMGRLVQSKQGVQYAAGSVVEKFDIPFATSSGVYMLIMSSTDNSIAYQFKVAVY